jgi:hypothetical protein
MVYAFALNVPQQGEVRSNNTGHTEFLPEFPMKRLWRLNLKSKKPNVIV